MISLILRGKNAALADNYEYNEAPGHYTDNIVDIRGARLGDDRIGNWVMIGVFELK